jgi:hypothetical protein
MAAAPPALGLALFGRDTLDLGPQFHFWVIVVSSAIAAVCAFTLIGAGARRDDAQVALMGTAFAAIATLLFLHGFSTPGVIAPMNGVVAIAGAAILPVGGTVLALAPLPGLRHPDAVRRVLIGGGALVAVIVLLGAIGLLFPELLPGLPEPGSPLAVIVLVAGALALAPATLRAARTYLLTRRHSDLLVVVGTAWLMVALWPQLIIGMATVGWWIGHSMELVGIALAGAPVALDLRRDRASRPLLGDLRAAELVAAEESFLGSRVRALMLALGRKDPSTEEHTRRVALLAVEVGEELGLSPQRLRELAIGGLLHDMGKLSVPDSILTKPGALDDDEFAVIRRHPAWGVDLLRELGGFSDGVLRLVGDHHERLDGKGYPSGLAGDELGLETRILTVCDVYDALVSDRVYRAAWTSERAFALLREESGTAFDPRCVEALARVTTGAVDEPPDFVTDLAPARSRGAVQGAIGTVAAIAGALIIAAGLTTGGASAETAGEHAHAAPAKAEYVAEEAGEYEDAHGEHAEHGEY